MQADLEGAREVSSGYVDIRPSRPDTPNRYIGSVGGANAKTDDLILHRIETVHKRCRARTANDIRYPLGRPHAARIVTEPYAVRFP